MEEQKKLIKEQLRYIGEDPDREGLIDTPKRIVKMWNEIYAGYKQNPADLFTVFSTDGYDQIVLLKDIQFYSMCEHHNVPFFGVAHIAYLPGQKVIGISKLARLLEVYTKRMQIQERNGQRITEERLELLPHAEKYYISPIFEVSTENTVQNIHWCLSYSLQNPIWNLSVQLHKILMFD